MECRKLANISVLLVFFTSIAYAETDTTQAQVIDGKKFFPLQSVKRFHGTPNQPIIIKPKYGNSSPVIVAKPAQAPITALPTNAKSEIPLAQPSSTTNNKNASDILSVFAPEDKSTGNQLVPQTNR